MLPLVPNVHLEKNSQKQRLCLKALRNLYNNYDYNVLYLSYILYPCVCLSRLCVACTQTSLALFQDDKLAQGFRVSYPEGSVPTLCRAMLRILHPELQMALALGVGSGQVAEGINQHLVSARVPRQHCDT